MQNTLELNIPIKPFKNRWLDYTKPVYVYRNLNCGKNINKKYSIKQSGLVVGHSANLILSNVEFKVSQASRQKVIKEQTKNVHAYAKGFLLIDEDESLVFKKKITYNPYENIGFLCNFELIEKADFVKFTEKGVYLRENNF